MGDLPDLALFQSSLKAIADSASGVSTLLDEAKSEPPSYSNGISLLGLKNSLLLAYLHHLTLFTLCRVQGRSIAAVKDKDKDGPADDAHPSPSVIVDGLVRNRIMLEKIKPLEVKLRYQIDKLLKKAENADRAEKEGRGTGAANGDDDEELGNGE